MMADNEPLRVELRVRDLTPTGLHDRQEAIYEQLLQLQEDGHISDVSVEVWGRQVPVEGKTNPVVDDVSTSAARSTYEEFDAWAERTGHDLAPAFSTRMAGSLITDKQDQKEVIRFPVICLAVYDLDELLAVVPCTTSEGVRTIDDCLATLQSGELAPGDIEVSE